MTSLRGMEHQRSVSTGSCGSAAACAASPLFSGVGPLFPVVGRAGEKLSFPVPLVVSATVWLIFSPVAVATLVMVGGVGSPSVGSWEVCARVEGSVLVKLLPAFPILFRPARTPGMSTGSTASRPWLDTSASARTSRRVTAVPASFASVEFPVRNARPSLPCSRARSPSLPDASVDDVPVPFHSLAWAVLPLRSRKAIPVRVGRMSNGTPFVAASLRMVLLLGSTCTRCRPCAATRPSFVGTAEVI